MHIKKWANPNKEIAIHRRRSNNPQREIRRQQELERMRVTQPIYRNKTRYSETYIQHN